MNIKSIMKNTPYPDLNRNKHLFFNYINGINKLGIISSTIYRNLPYNEIIKHEFLKKDGVFLNTKYGPTYSIDTGVFTGRSPKDKWIVKNPGSKSDRNIYWGDINKSMDPIVFDELYSKSIDYFNTLDEIYVFDGFCGADPTTQKKVRFIHEIPWQHHFVTNMFIRPDEHELNNFEPDFTIINACSLKNENWKKHGLNSDVAIALNIEKKVGVIMGTWYGGENKKGIFSLMNYWLPLDNVMSMHCSSNIGKNGDSALFFGLSGTGKTTLSADPNRYLLGDDEHGWGGEGIFNLEGGCYAKTNGLSEYEEPNIYRAIKPNALLENVSNDKYNKPDYNNTQKTENGRVSYPIDHINNWYKPQIAEHPKNIIFLTCDAFGVLPPVSKLSHNQAMYHFISGYTAKVSGTERGVTEPTATFSACFGEAFLPLHPSVYADIFKNKLKEHDSNVFLVNTGWTGGKYGEGNRIRISDTRKCIDSILSGDILNCNFIKDEIFGFEFPEKVNGISDICNPRNTWKNKEEYDKQYIMLAKMFQDNYSKYINKKFTNYNNYGPKL